MTNETAHAKPEAHRTFYRPGQVVLLFEGDSGQRANSMSPEDEEKFRTDLRESLMVADIELDDNPFKGPAGLHKLLQYDVLVDGTPTSRILQTVEIRGLKSQNSPAPSALASPEGPSCQVCDAMTAVRDVVGALTKSTLQAGRYTLIAPSPNWLAMPF